MHGPAFLCIIQPGSDDQNNNYFTDKLGSCALIYIAYILYWIASVVYVQFSGGCDPQI